MVCWQEPGLQRLEQPPGCFGDRIPVTCHPRKICMSHIPPTHFPFQTCLFSSCLPQELRVCLSVHVCSALPVRLSLKWEGGGRKLSLIFPYFPFFLIWFFHEVGTNSPLIGLFTEKIIRITKMAEFSAPSSRFNHTKPFISVFKRSFFSPPLFAAGSRGRRVYSLSLQWLMPQLH